MVETRPFGLGKHENKKVGFQPFNIGFGSNTFSSLFEKSVQTECSIMEVPSLFS